MAAVIILERILQQSEGLNVITGGGGDAGRAQATVRFIQSQTASNHLTLLELYLQRICCNISPLCTCSVRQSRVVSRAQLVTWQRDTLFLWKWLCAAGARLC